MLTEQQSNILLTLANALKYSMSAASIDDPERMRMQEIGKKGFELIKQCKSDDETTKIILLSIALGIQENHTVNHDNACEAQALFKRLYYCNSDIRDSINRILIQPINIKNNPELLNAMRYISILILREFAESYIRLTTHVKSMPSGNEVSIPDPDGDPPFYIAGLLRFFKHTYSPLDWVSKRDETSAGIGKFLIDYCKENDLFMRRALTILASILQKPPHESTLNIAILVSNMFDDLYRADDDFKEQIKNALDDKAAIKKLHNKIPMKEVLMSLDIDPNETITFEKVSTPKRALSS